MTTILNIIATVKRILTSQKTTSKEQEGQIEDLVPPIVLPTLSGHPDFNLED